MAATTRMLALLGAAVLWHASLALAAPMRRGHGDSERRCIQYELRNQPDGVRKRLQVELLETEQLDDQLAGLAYLKRLPYVDQRRLAVAGCSAAQSWRGNPLLRERLIRAVQNIDIPERLQTHCFGGIGRGSRVWANDALNFLVEALR